MASYGSPLRRSSGEIDGIKTTLLIKSEREQKHTDENLSLKLGISPGASADCAHEGNDFEKISMFLRQKK